MPSFTMHIAIANEYIRKHKNEIKNIKEFVKGNIYPDLTNNKNITHYGEWGNGKTNIIFENFINDSKIDLSKDFYKGYFLHLLADDFTYNYSLKDVFDKVRKDETGKIIYEEFYYLNKFLLSKYEINNIPEEVIEFTKVKDGNLNYLKPDKVFEMIDDISSINLEEQIKYLKNNKKPKYNIKEV